MFKYRNIIRFVCYLVFLAGALAYPVKKILSFEYPAVSPSVYQFRVETVDPYDPLRGRYLLLTVHPQRLLTEDTTPQWGNGSMRLHPLAVLGTAEDGTADVIALVETPEQVPQGHDFIRLAGVRHSSKWAQGKPSAPYCYYLKFPFDRFFINEQKAEAVDKKLRRAPGQEVAPGILVVKVFPNGNFMPEDLLVDGKSVL